MNYNIHLSEGNIKSKCTNDVTFLTWSLPSGLTCPYSTNTCRKRCFAKKNENFEGVRASRIRNLEECQKETFVNDMIEVIEHHLRRRKNNGKKIFVRIHTSGDFMDVAYFEKWRNIAEHFKDNKLILFQAYTKSMPIIQKCIQSKTDVNIHLVWSIWNDTPKEFTESAKKLGLQTFTALPKTEINDAVSKGAFLCNGDCGNCRECYTGSSESIVIPYH